MFFDGISRWLSLGLILFLVFQPCSTELPILRHFTSSISVNANDLAEKLSSAENIRHRTGRPVHLVSIDEDSNFIVNTTAVDEILLAENIRDRKVVVLSIAGAFKEGKSFLLGFFLRYLNVTYNPDNKQNYSYWLGDESQPIQGFSFKTSQERTTTGIQMWSEPFLTTLPNGEEVAILLLDTQGLFDGSTPYADNVKIFGLTTLMSSIQMFNIMQKVQEDRLQLLKFVTDYGSIVANHSAKTTEPSFQKFIFLIRDWANAHETPYGFQGGEIYLDKVLKTTKAQHEELRAVRKQIKSCFTNISCFLLPYPGEKVVKDPKFIGQLSDVEEEFKVYLRELVQSILLPENLVLKTINGETVTVWELVSFLKLYVKALNNKDTLEPKSIINANAEMSYQKAVKIALEDYSKRMKALFDSSEMIPEKKQMIEKSAEYRTIARNLFHNCTKLPDPKLDEVYLKELHNIINDYYSSFQEEAEQRREIYNLKNFLATKNKEVADLSKANQEIMRNLDTLINSQTATKEEVQKMKDQLGSSQQKINSINAIRGEYEQRLERMERELRKIKNRGFLERLHALIFGD